MSVVLKKNVRLKDYTTFKIGGNADELIEVYKTHDLVGLLNEPYKGKTLILGGGSNVLVSDLGYRGRVIVLKNRQIEFRDDFCVADAGVLLPHLYREFYLRGLSSIEFASAIPGTLGGACIMNAGAFDGSISQRLVFVEVLREGQIISLKPEECGFAYRTSGFLPGDVILRAGISFVNSDKERIKNTVKEYSDYRKKTQPKGFSAGSVFKAPSGGKSAGYYIDMAGLKGLSCGGAEISKIHANFIINNGSATAENVAALIDIIKAEIKTKFNIVLNEEIKYIGDF